VLKIANVLTLTAILVIENITLAANTKESFNMLVPFLTLILLVFLVRGIYRDYPDDMLEEEIETETISSLLAPIAGIAIINIADIILKAFGIS
jgi:hypothetical protein